MVEDLKTKNHHTHDGKCVESGNEEHTFVFVSPDGVLITGEKENWSGNKDSELSDDFKSPFFRTLAHLEVPKQYVPQLELESYASKTKATLFVSCTKEFLTAFLCRNNDVYMQ